MTPSENKPQESIELHLEEVRRLLSRPHLREETSPTQDISKEDLEESLEQHQNLTELQNRLEQLPLNELSLIVQSLLKEEQLEVLELLNHERAAAMLCQISAAAREILLTEMNPTQLADALETLDKDRLVAMSSRMPQHTMDAIYTALDDIRSQELQAALAYQHTPISSLKAFVLNAGRLVQLQSLTPEDLLRPDIVWVDMVDPTDEERELVQRAFRMELPEDEELQDLEESARCYADEHGLHISSFFLHKEGEDSANVTVSFVLNAGRLLTIRQEELTVFRLFRLRARVQPGFVSNAQDILLAIYDAAVEYDADMLEEVYTELESISKGVLNREEDMTDQLMGETVTRLAIYEDINGKVRLDLMDTRRALSFLLRSRILGSGRETDLREILRDLESLNNHTGFLFDKINFLMDALMGMINLSQNTIIRRLTVLSVVFMPLNVLAGIGGMSEFSMMTKDIPWPIAYAGFTVGLLIVAWITLLTLRHYENRNKNRAARKQLAGRP